MWVNSQVQYAFSDFLNKLVLFHDNQWKAKYHDTFVDLADICDAVLSLVTTDERPADADVKFASLSGCIKTLLKVGIVDKKSGAEVQQDFMQQYNQLSEAWGKFAFYYSDYDAKYVAKKGSIENKSSISANLIQDDPDTMAAKIAGLRRIVEIRNVETAGSWYKRAWKQHPKKMATATGLFGCALVTEGVNAFHTYAGPIVDQFLEAHIPIPGLRHQHVVLGFSALAGLASAGFFASSMSQSRRQALPLQGVTVELDELLPESVGNDEQVSLLRK